jgi:hypothetical protein
LFKLQGKLYIYSLFADDRARFLVPLGLQILASGILALPESNSEWAYAPETKRVPGVHVRIGFGNDGTGSEFRWSSFYTLDEIPPPIQSLIDLCRSTVVDLIQAGKIEAVAPERAVELLETSRLNALKNHRLDASSDESMEQTFSRIRAVATQKEWTKFFESLMQLACAEKGVALTAVETNNSKPAWAKTFKTFDGMSFEEIVSQAERQNGGNGEPTKPAS